jgi:hypothetical protein
MAYLKHIRNIYTLIQQRNNDKFMSGCPTRQALLDVQLHVVQRAAALVLTNIYQELEQQLHINCDDLACGGVRLETSVARVRETNVEPSFVIPEIAECVLLSALPVLVAKNCPRQTRDLDSAPDGAILRPGRSISSDAEASSSRVVTIEHLERPSMAIVDPPLLHSCNGPCENNQLFFCAR